MAINNFIPTIWSGRILLALEKAFRYAQPGVVNNDYEGEIRQAGDTVKINSIGDPTIFTYTKNTDMPAVETLTDATRSLIIDQSPGFNFQVDDVDRVQARGGAAFDVALYRAGYKLADVADLYVANLMAAAGTNTIGTTTVPIEVTPTNAYDQLVKMKIKLDKALAPSEGRFVIVPSWFSAALGLDSRFVGTRGMDTNSVLMTGQVGQAAGFNIIESQNVPNTTSTKFKIVGGVSGATTFAMQIDQTEAYKPERRFGDAVKGLQLYGAKVIRPEELVVLTANDNLGLGA